MFEVYPESFHPQADLAFDEVEICTRRRACVAPPWLRKQNRVAANPFEIISKVDMRGKQRSQRRALNDDEAKRLLAGPRKLLYLFAGHAHGIAAW